MKICHLITTIERGGAEKQLATLVREQVIEGHKVSIIYLKGDPELEEVLIEAGAKVLPGIANRNLIAQIIRLMKANSKIKFDLINAHLPRSEIVARLSKGKIPLVVTRHNSEPFYPGKPRAVSSMLSRWVTRCASGVIAISNAVANYLVENNELSRRTTLRIIHYGIPISQREISFRKQRTQVTVLLSIARLVPQKNLQLLIQSFAQYAVHNLNSQLMLVGQGYLASALKEQARRLGVDHKIVWIEKVANVEDVLRQADCFILPSLYEGFGLVLLEAMHAQVPVISSDIPTSREIFGEDYRGLFASDSPEALLYKLQVFEDLQVREESVLWQNRRLKEFDIKESCRQTLQLYSEKIGVRSKQ